MKMRDLNNLPNYGWGTYNVNERNRSCFLWTSYIDNKNQTAVLDS